ncbi:glutamyl-tRNA reductase [Aestuariibacter sp. AA17]|uniref:Glutamyl-tRNA reductase n=1 Tax=Fluctibacter corallii TaxID=2984329 RepID=A0ABT3AEK9_9ALTE|nr:glutamyl-tRNA reductase [Aestuariibacter sp. AA17]MCV2886666.1 glutamyl-tRNA reductase [Aestuariibacter sp. AA17]
MTLLAFGINHKTAPVALRERVAFSPDALVQALESLKEEMSVEESVVLSTCNRTEVYVQAEDISGKRVADWLAQFHGVNFGDLIENSYAYENEDAVHHVMRVASGLDSLILGEPQILGQVKQAYTSAKNTGTVSSNFERLFQQTFSVAKKVRSETDIGANAVSVAFAAVQLARHIFSSLEKSKVLLIGAGETIELVARHLKEQNVSSMMVANRTLARAQSVAAPLGAQVLTLAQIPQHLHEADIVISSTASQLPIVGKGMVERALKARRHKPIFMVDLAVPRDIEGEVSELDDAYLYTVDDLQQIVQKNLDSRRHAAAEAEKIISNYAQQYLAWTQEQASIDVIKTFRQQSEAQKTKLQARALNQLAEGKAPEQVIIELANKLTNSLMHAPTKALKNAAQAQDKRRLSVLADTFGLETKPTPDAYCEAKNEK